MKNELLLEGIGEECLRELVQTMKDLIARAEARIFDRSSLPGRGAAGQCPNDDVECCSDAPDNW